jgi:hypothetical protein
MGQIPGAVAGDIVDHSIYLDTNQFIGNRDGTQKLTFGTSGITLTGVWSLPAGTAAAPSVSFATATGLYGVTTSVLGVAIAGVAGLAIAGSSPTFAAATDTVGKDVYIKAADAGGTATTAKAGGLLNIAAGAGSAGSTTVAGGVGGAFTLTAGAGGAKAGTGAAAGGAGGAFAIAGGAGGATASSGSDAGGAGGAFTLTGGAGGNATAGTGNGGAGGSITIAGGPGGTSAGGTAGARGVVTAQGLRTIGTTAVAITGAVTLVQADSGGIFTIDQDAAFDIDLPSPALGAGLVFDFVLTDAGTNDVTITVAGGAATFVGTIVNDVTSVLPATGSTLTFANGVAAVGDNIRIQSIATNLYLVRAVTSANGGITIA